MIIFLAMLLMALGVLSFILLLYDLYCVTGAHKFDKDVEKKGTEALEGSSKLNLIIYIIKRSKSVKKATSSSIKRAVSTQVKLLSSIAMSATMHLVYAAFFCIITGVALYTIEQQIVTTSTVLQTLFSKDDNCQCYAKCTGNAEDDEKCVYELIFGEAQYEKLIEHMEEKLPYADIEYFDDLDSGTDGKAKSDFIRERINESMVEDYRLLVGSNSKFRKGDGKDRSQMSYDELKDDLFNLLCDYKVKGRNPNCECGTCSSIQLKYKCIGMNHYKEGWSWDALWGDDDDDDSDDTTGNQPGNATGKFALQLDDGTFYWYHQSAEKCDYDAFDTSYGYVGSCRAGGASKNTMAHRGCGIYSTAMALSNLLGEEITPWKVITEVMGCTVKQAPDGTMYFEATSANGISYGSSVCMDMPKLAELINAKYGSKGLVAEVASFDQSTIDSYLYSDDSYAYCITSYAAASNFTWYTGSGHFMVLRPGSGTGKYKCFTSASTKYGSGHDNIKKGMNDELSWSIVKSAEKHGQCVMISRDKSYYNTDDGGTGGGAVGYNKEVYDILIKDSRFSSKALALASVYATLEPAYGKNFAIGMMANVYAEGNFGLIEGIWTSNSPTKTKTHQLTCSCHNGLWTYPYWGKVGADVHAVCTADGNGSTIVNASRVDYLLANIPSGTSGIGVGTAGWSGGRRVNLLNTFKSSCKSYSQDELAIAEVIFMKSEFEGGYSSVVTSAQGKSAEECAKIICLDYEKPANMQSAANTRATYAAQLYDLLKNVTTSGATAGGDTGGGGGMPKEDTDDEDDGGGGTTSSKGQDVVNYATQFVGNHYKWGGTKLTVSNWQNNAEHLSHDASEALKKTCPLDGADCSGFVLAVYSHFGVSLPHSSSSLASVGERVQNPSVSNMQPGDIVCYSGHVAIYIGGGKIVHASSHSSGIKISNDWDYKTVVSVRRIFK